MTGYTKLFHSILASTVWREPNEVRIVWITMLAMADRHGLVEGSVPGLADFARVTVDECRSALERLAAPDPDSRSKEDDGRRIRVVDGGWQLVNHAKYRAKMSADDRREYLRRKQQQYRASKRDGVSTPRQQASTNVANVSAGGHIAEAEAEADQKKDRARSETGVVSNTSPPVVTPGSLTARARMPAAPMPEIPDPDLAERAGRFCETFEELYTKHLRGARYLRRPTLDWSKACELCERWDDHRLTKLAAIFLTSDDQWITAGPRSIGAFAARASWCDAKLAEWEAKQQGGQS